MRFGRFTALDNVSIQVAPGTFHALLGENGAGKSTLVKCMMGFYRATSGAMMIDGREVLVPNPRDAHALGLGMVYQHFTLVPSLTAAENLVVSRENTPAVINWRREMENLQTFLRSMPFSVPLDRPVQTLSVGEKQKLEILKQIFLGRRFLILDEPTNFLDRDSLGALACAFKEFKGGLFMISHNAEFYEALCPEKWILESGRLTVMGAEWMEEVEKARRDYLKSARSHTRGKLMRQVDEAWETQVPLLSVEGRDVGGGGDDSTGREYIARKLRETILPTV